jgi:CRP-like cAMP-binding protein
MQGGQTLAVAPGTEPPDLREPLARALRQCRPPTIDALVATARLRTVHPGDRIYAQGQPVPLTLILDGHFAFRRTTTEGQDIINGVASPGHLFGFSSMTSVLSSVELVALTDGQVALWPGSEIRDLARTDVGLALDAIDSMASALHAMVERVEGFLHQEARRRVIRILARHRALFFDDPAVLTRAHLPGLVGTSREMTGRVLRQLEAEGTIARAGRTHLRLLRPDQLDAGLD